MTITTWETMTSAWNAEEYGLEPEYSKYQIKDYTIRRWDEIGQHSKKRLQNMIYECPLSFSHVNNKWFIVEHRWELKPMLLRKEYHKNDFPDRAGQRMIIARRLGGRLYSLKFIRYGPVYTRIRLYRITKDQYNQYINLYGMLTDHSRIYTEHLLATNRKYYDIWVARHKRTTNMYVVYPNNTAEKIADIPGDPKGYAIGWRGWNPELDEFGNRWLYTTFKIKRKVFEEVTHGVRTVPEST